MVTPVKEENYFIRCLIFMVMLLLSSFLAFDSPSGQQRAGKFVDVPPITSQENPRLGADEFLRSFEIRVETKKGNF